LAACRANGIWPCRARDSAEAAAIANSHDEHRHLSRLARHQTRVRADLKAAIEAMPASRLVRLHVVGFGAEGASRIEMLSTA
jgi:hypothetical protein